MTAASGTIDLFAKLTKKKAADAPPTPEAKSAPPTQEQIGAEPALGVNPPMPEGTPLAPPVGTVEAKAPKGRPKGAKNKPKVEPQTAEPAPSADEPTAVEIKACGLPIAPFDDAGFDVQWAELGSAVKKFLKAVA